MYCGIDFGTSNSSVGVWGEAGPVLVPLSAENVLMPSVVFMEQGEFADLAVNEALLARRVAVARAAEDARRDKAKRDGASYRGLSDADLERRERELMRRELVTKEEGRSPILALSDSIDIPGKLKFGDEAIRANAAAPGEGHYFKSPKLFLGADLHPAYIDVFTKIIAAMLREVRRRSEAHLGRELREVVIGHPVVYSLAKGDSGNRQALASMESAARTAGFTQIAFLPEPFAAALSYEMSCTSDETLLVVDIGGGTTDCAVIRIGPGRRANPDRKSDVLSYAGERIGGVDMDQHLAWRQIMPLLGMGSMQADGRPLPSALFHDAISIHDFPAQERFRKSGSQIEAWIAEAREPDKLRLFHYLWKMTLQYRLIRSAELAKIELSDKEAITLPLDYIDSELQVPIARADLLEAIDTELEQIGAISREAVDRAATRIDKIFLTGGASRSPDVLRVIKGALGLDVPVLRGDDFGSVTLGLARYAHSLYGKAA